MAAAVCATALAACGKSGQTHNADNEGLYVNVGSLLYQVQNSRELNPYSAEDFGYLAGLPTATAALTPQQAWFGVFMLVVNKTAHAQPATGEYYITDTEENVYKPIPNPGTNPFSYRSVTVPAHSQLPLPSSPASTGATGGEVLLFKLPFTAFDNRPLDLHIVNQAQPTERAIVELDV